MFPNPRRSWRSPLPIVGATAALTSGTAYFTFIDYFAFAVTPQFIEFWLQTAGTGAQTAEIGLFSTPAFPNKANQSLTKLVATGTVDSVVAGAPVTRRNTNPFATVIPGGTFLWAGFRVANAATQPTLTGVIADFAEGYVLTTAGAGVLTGAGPFAGVIPTTAVGGGALNSGGTVGLAFSVTLD